MIGKQAHVHTRAIGFSFSKHHNIFFQIWVWISSSIIGFGDHFQRLRFKRSWFPYVSTHRIWSTRRKIFSVGLCNRAAHAKCFKSEKYYGEGNEKNFRGNWNSLLSFRTGYMGTEIEDFMNDLCVGETGLVFSRVMFDCEEKNRAQ